MKEAIIEKKSNNMEINNKTDNSTLNAVAD